MVPLKLKGDVLTGFRCDKERDHCKEQRRIYRASHGHGNCVAFLPPKFSKSKFVKCNDRVDNFLCVINAK